MTQVKKDRHVPMRTCIATREKRPKNELIRFVLDNEDSKVKVDLRSKIKGRGANLLPTEEAFDIMVKKKVLKHALKLEQNLTEEEYAELKKEFLEAVGEKNFRPNNRPVTVRLRK